MNEAPNPLIRPRPTIPIRASAIGATSIAELPIARQAIPSIFEQTTWPCGYFEIPPERDVRWFNPSIAQWNGRTWLAVRRAYSYPPPLGINSIVLWDMDGVRLKGRNAISFWHTHAQEHYEDPRLVVLDGQLYVSCTNFKIANYKAHQILAKISNITGQYCPTAHILYGRNGLSMDGNSGNEKNWTWFPHADGWHFVYEPWPHHVVRTNQGEAAASYVQEVAHKCPWDWGIMRGGSPPVLIDGLYYSFFHSSVHGKAPEPRRRYYMGCYTFEAHPPFHIRSMTLEPLLVGSERDGGTLPVVFPGGAIYQDGKWLVVLGVNDHKSAWIEIPHAEMKERLLNL